MILFTKILDVYDIWEFVANFAHLASFQAIEFVDWPIRKTMDICVSDKRKQSFLYKMQHSVTV